MIDREQPPVAASRPPVNPRLVTQLSAALERRQTDTRAVLESGGGKGAQPPARRHGRTDLVATIRQLFNLGDQCPSREHRRRG